MFLSNFFSFLIQNNIIVHKELCLALTVLKPYIISFENSLKSDINSVKNSVDPDPDFIQIIKVIASLWS